MSYSRPDRRVCPEPAWRSVSKFTAAELPQQQRYWLLDNGSLTGHLVRNAHTGFSVQRLFQGWQVPSSSERKLLGLSLRERALIREVILLDGMVPLVYARSVFPISCLSGSLGHLRTLKNKPLGAILFNNPAMHRSPFELAKINRGHSYLPSNLCQSDAVWGRRSRFAAGSKALMVSEVFLDAFQPWPGSSPVHRSQRGKVNAAKSQPKQ